MRMDYYKKHQEIIDVTEGASCRAAVAATVERFGGLDVLLYGAADIDRAATALEMDEAAWDRVIRVNLTGAFLMVKAAIPAMIARGGGSLILVASQLGRVASPGRAAYCATKGGLIQLAKMLAADHAAQGLRSGRYGDHVRREPTLRWIAGHRPMSPGASGPLECSHRSS